VNSNSSNSSSNNNNNNNNNNPSQQNEDAKQYRNNNPNLNPNHEDFDLRAIERRTQTILESGGGNLPSPDNKPEPEPEPDHFDTNNNYNNHNSLNSHHLNHSNSNQAKSAVLPTTSSRPSSRAQTAKLINPESEKEWDTTNAIINRKNSTPEKYYRTPPPKSEAKNETTKSQRNALHTPVNLMLSPDLEPLYDINNEPKDLSLDQKALTEVSSYTFIYFYQN
jgi:hypothetical protein